MSNRNGLSIAVVIPTKDEAAAIADCLTSVINQTEPPIEIIVADGGSTDQTAELARAFNATVIRCPRLGRGNQIADALAKTSADVALVLHADSLLPNQACAKIMDWLSQNPACPGGCLGHRFSASSFGLAMVEIGDYLRAKFWAISFGDQGQFFRTAAVAQVGGFPELPLMEDYELALRLKKLGRPAYLNLPVLCSARRFQKLGIWQTLKINREIRRAYRNQGLPACQELYERYYLAESFSRNGP